MNYEKIKETGAKFQEYIIEKRRHFKENPEIAGLEIETSKILKEEMTLLGFEIKEAKGTGFIAILDSQKPGKVVGFRADIDALPMDESEINLVGPKVCSSKKKGAAHTCGHDGHMAMALGVAKILNELKDELTGKVVFIFEEGEEAGFGIFKMLELLEKEDLKFDAILGNHVASFVETGKFALEAGPRMAGVAKISFNIVGRGGHGSRPDLSINPIFAATQVLNGLTTAWANQLDVTKTVTLGIAQIQGGTAFNIFPDKVHIAGSLRFFDEEEGKKAMDIFQQITTKYASAHNCQVEWMDDHQILYTPVINDKEYSGQARTTIANLYGQDSLQDEVLWFGSESFSKYASQGPIVFNFIGIKNDAMGSGAEHHNVHFDLDEGALIPGAIASAGILVDFLEASS